MQDSKTSALGRVLLSALFLIAGFGKLAAPAATQGYIASVGLPFPVLGYLVALFVEIGLGLALLVGFQARVSAAIMALFTLATAVFFHSNFADQNMFIHFFKNVAITGGLLQVVAYGAGAWSLDARRARVAVAA
jgi:putative oxidoreductase